MQQIETANLKKSNHRKGQREQYSEDRNSKSEKTKTTEKDRESSMDQFLLEIKEYSKKMKDDENHGG